MQRTFVFDNLHALSLTHARQDWLRSWLPEFRLKFDIKTALDAGCGVGYFSGFLQDMGFQVTAFDGRQENIEEARRRHPDITFHVANVEDRSVLELGKFDLVLCFGLLYHLENPFAAVRNLWMLTKKILLIESMVLPKKRPVLLLRDEGKCEDQGLNFVAFMPSETAIIKMLYRSGFPYVYRFRSLPDHSDFHNSIWHHQIRTVLMASLFPVDLPFVELVSEPSNTADPWETAWNRWTRMPRRAWYFLRKPWPEKVRSIRYRYKRLLSRLIPWFPVPVRLPFGAWYLAWADCIGNSVFAGNYEEYERQFVEKFVKSGVIALDIGAHQGFYSLLMSRLVGPWGQVIAFEPSPRERRRLRWNLHINRCRNVRVEPLALAAEERELHLFVVKGRETGCNSLRPPAVSEPVEVVPVWATTLDVCLERLGVEKVGFIKMDVEGAELEVLKGAERFLSRFPRPVWMCEVQDIRTQAFGYPAREVLEFLWQRGYHWFKIADGGRLLPLKRPEELMRWQGYNFVAVPEERLEEVDSLLAEA